MEKLDFNRNWRVRKEGGADRPVNLPDDAMLREERRADARCGSGGAFFAGGKYLYTKDLEIEPSFAGKTLILEFEGVYQNARVLVNDRLAAEHPYGYTGFFADITELVHPGSNTVTVIADNSRIPNTRWYSGSGIYRPVSLYAAGTAYIAPDGLQITCLDEHSIHITVTGNIPEDAEIRLTVFDPAGVPVATGVGTDTVLTVAEPILWSAESPKLYTCRAELTVNSTIADTSESRFGIRTLSWGKAGFLVNGTPVLLRGGCIHHDNGILGACAFPDAARRQVRILKEAGFNAIRSAHNPLSKAMLEACDEQGLYVMDEAFDMWLIHKNPYDYAGETFRDWWQKDLTAMLQKDRSHPCVVMYSIGNEISELGRKDGQTLAREMTDLCHREDPTRPVTAGINLALAQMAALQKSTKASSPEDGKIKDDTKGAPTSEVFNKLMNYLGERMDKAASTGKANQIASVMADILDIPGYNYGTSRYKSDAESRPEQPTVGSETMTYKLYGNWKLVKQYPSVIGDFQWTGWDHLGESGLGTVRYLDKKTRKDTEPGLIISSGAGVIDICGNPRPETHWNKLIWGLTKEPAVSVAPYTHAGHFVSKRMWRKTDTVASWSWDGYEGVKSAVTVYANAPVVELYANGVSLGKRKTKELTAVFPRIPYTPGTLEATALDEMGNILGRCALHSATGKTELRLTPEVQELRSNGQDLCYLSVELVGENGQIRSSADVPLTVTVSGSGTLQAFGSARPNMAEDFLHDTHTTYYGRALAVIRAGCTPGTVTVTVSGPELHEETVTLTVK